LPIDLIDAGLRTLVIPLRDLEAEISVFPDEQVLKAFCIANNIDIILIYSQEVKAQNNIAHTRVFAPKFGYLEDPATGSGNSAFGYYMLKNKLWDGTDCCIEQGGKDRVFNSVRLSLANGAVLFGGKATVRIDGFYFMEHLRASPLDE
jgi:PhzF family phenazine biosynthesis protein